jgi:hypothetical protein
VNKTHRATLHKKTDSSKYWMEPEIWNQFTTSVSQKHTRKRLRLATYRYYSMWHRLLRLLRHNER